jgi:hypothetical protein
MKKVVVDMEVVGTQMKVVVGMEVVGTQMKLDNEGNGTIVKILVKEEADGGMIMIIFRGKVVQVIVLANGEATEQAMTTHSQEETISHGVW